MTDAYQRNKEFYGNIGGYYHVAATDNNVIPLVAAIPKHTIFVQRIHVEVTTLAASELWTYQDGAAIPIVPAVSAGAIAHFDFDFGPDGAPCTEGTPFNLNITGATGAVGWTTWEGYKKLTSAVP